MTEIKKTVRQDGQVFGFDCAHYGDWTPYSPFGHCWEVDDVVKECKSLIDQLIEIEE